MTAKTLVIRADLASRERLASALRLYAEAAYPPGGSECGQAAREALLNTAVQLTTDSGEELTISRRIKPRLTAAIAYYCEHHREVDPQPLLGLLDQT